MAFKAMDDSLDEDEYRSKLVCYQNVFSARALIICIIKSTTIMF